MNRNRTKDFLVRWEIDIEAASPVAAAQVALGTQRDVESTATVFEVIDKGTGREWLVDLGAPQEGLDRRLLRRSRGYQRDGIVRT